MRKVSKYRNVICEVDGMKFHSKKEARHYGYLKVMKLAGEVIDFKCQVEYKIVEDGELICKYIADFVVYYPNNIIEVWDVKSPITRKNPVYRLKKKLLKAIHKVDIVEK